MENFITRKLVMVLIFTVFSIPLMTFQSGCSPNSQLTMDLSDPRPYVVVVIGEDHFYGAIDSMWELAKALQSYYGMHCTVLQAVSRTSIPGLEALEDADLAIFFIRRRVLSRESMQHVHEYLEAGKPLIAFRTTSHAFAPVKQAFSVFQDTSPTQSNKAEEKSQEATDRAPWPEFDRQVLGGYYRGYYLGETRASVVPEMKDHPVLQGINGPYQLRETLYINLPLADTATVLMMGKCVDGIEGVDKRYRSEKNKEHIDQPVAWLNTYKSANIFYTSMGNGQAAFKQSWFRRMIINSVFWALDHPVPSVEDKKYISKI
jgi:hypothetical protein